MSIYTHMLIIDTRITFSFDCGADLYIYQVSVRNCREEKSFIIMMASSNGIIFRFTGPFCGEFTGDRWIPLKKASDAES